MWLLFLAVASRFLANRWKSLQQQRSSDEQEDDKKHPVSAPPAADRSQEDEEIEASDGEEEMGDKLRVDQESSHSGRRMSKRLFGSSRAPKDHETAEQQQQQQEEAPSTAFAAGKRTTEFSKHAIQEGSDLTGFEVKRMRDCHEFKAQEQSLLSGFTCSFVDNPGLADLWFAPHQQDGDGRIKSRTPARAGKSRGVFRRSRYMRGSPKPVSSLESCLRAQLHFDEDKRVSRSLFFEDGRSPGLAQVQALDSTLRTEAAESFGARRNHSPSAGRLPPLVRRRLKPKQGRAPVNRSHEALFFSFGVSLGVMQTTAASNAEVERLQTRLKQAEMLVEELQVQHDRSKSLDREQGNMAELEAQLEAELELMQLQSSSEVDGEDDFGEVLHDHLIATGLPGASSDVEDDKNESGKAAAEGNGMAWAVSPRELDKRLRMLLEVRQEERIARLEEELENAQNQLVDREKELALWKERVRLLTEITVSSSAQRERDETRASPKSRKADLPLRFSREQSPSDDICDEFLKSVDIGREAALDASEVEENWQEAAVAVKHYEPVPVGDTIQHGRSSSNELEVIDPPVEHDRKTSPLWNYRFMAHAGAATPIEDFHSSRLFNTPRSRKQDSASVLDKIRYWENLSKEIVKSEEASSPEPGRHTPQTETQVSPFRFSCSEVSSCDDDDSSVSDAEEHVGDFLIKRILEKSKKGSTLLKDVQMMLAALDCESG